MSRGVDSSSILMDAPALENGWPPEVELIISALQAGSARDGAEPFGQHPAPIRCPARMDYRVRATLRLYSDLAGSGPWRLYTRDASSRGLGFLTPHRLPLGYGGTVELRAPAGDIVNISCTLLRCREVASGWFDGALTFNRDQFHFAAD